jgi:hypothetical protein
MTIEWLAGNRLRGTTAERPEYGLPSGSVGGWVEVGRTTLGSNDQTIDITSIPDKRYYMVLYNLHFIGAATGGGFRLNNDSGTNYSWRYSQNGAADATFGTNQSNIHFLGGHSGRPEFYVSYISNLANKEKLCIMHRNYKGDGGATSIPQRIELVGKWTNTSNAINQMTGYQGGSDTFTSGDEIVVLGWDPADTHTSNFWQELASVELGSAGDNLGSDTFTAKKYLWIQVFLKASGTYNTRFRVNSDSGSNYSVRWSDNGTADSTDVSQSAFYPVVDGATTNITTNSFMNMFILNNTSKEKLIMWNGIVQNTAGAGNAPARVEGVAKWANTSAQITDIDIDNTSTGDYDTGSIIKVWGAD